MCLVLVVYLGGVRINELETITFCVYFVTSVFCCTLSESSERTRQTELKMDAVIIKFEGLYAYLLMSNFRLYFAFLRSELINNK